MFFQTIIFDILVGHSLVCILSFNLALVFLLIYDLLFFQSRFLYHLIFHQLFINSRPILHNQLSNLLLMLLGLPSTLTVLLKILIFNFYQCIDLFLFNPLIIQWHMFIQNALFLQLFGFSFEIFVLILNHKLLQFISIHFALLDHIISLYFDNLTLIP